MIPISQMNSFVLSTAVDSYGLDNDDFNTEELEEAVADIQDTLEADNYEDQLPQPEVRTILFIIKMFFFPHKFKYYMYHKKIVCIFR